MKKHLCAAGTTLITLALALLPVAKSPSDDMPDAGPIRFTELLLKDQYGYAYGVAAADLDGDGNLDLTSVDTVNNLCFWFAGDGKGNFKRYTIAKDEEGWLERHVIGDVNGDGHPDVVVVKNLREEVLWFQNSGKPREDETWKRHVITTKFHRAYDVVLADLAGTGRLDIAASAWRGNQLAWFENSGKKDDKEWTRHILDDKLTESRTIRAADFNGDGKQDLLATGSGANLVAWYENPGKPTDRAWTRHVIDDQSPRPIHGHPVDMDGDGDMDVVMALGMIAAPGQKDTHQVVWYENVGKPGKGTEWKKHVIGELNYAFEAVAVDLNGEGKLDVVATAWGPNGQLVWFENPGDPHKTPWQKHVLKAKWVNANQVIVADLNKDGRPDIIASAERGSNEVRWWRNEGPRKP